MISGKASWLSNNLTFTELYEEITVRSPKNVGYDRLFEFRG